jgi:hypothetical protein
MIARELLEELKTIRRNFDWYYDGTTRKIRARLKLQGNNMRFDPIGAVCYSKTGVTFGESDWWRSAELLELSHIDAGDLTAAANNVVQGPGQAYLHDLRRQMIDGVFPQPEGRFTERLAAADLITGYLPSLLRKKAHRGAKS